MKLKLYPILSEMKEFYQKTPLAQRFGVYLTKLQGGSKGDLKLAIGGFNPMAKEHVLKKMVELEMLEAERIMIEAISEFNQKNESSDSQEIKILFNLADDLKGGWTNRYATDFDSKFKINAIAARGFCTPYFWSSEEYSADLIWSRTIEYAYRTKYWLENGRLKTLKDHLDQEVFVAKRVDIQNTEANIDIEMIAAYYEANKTSVDYNLIFNFFYGDEVSRSLSYSEYGIEDSAGFKYALELASVNG